MRKVIFFGLLLIMLFGSLNLFSQEGNQPKRNLFVKSVTIVKILTHKLGYRIYYVKVY